MHHDICIIPYAPWLMHHTICTMSNASHHMHHSIHAWVISLCTASLQSYISWVHHNIAIEHLHHKCCIVSSFSYHDGIHSLHPCINLTMHVLQSALGESINQMTQLKKCVIKCMAPNSRTSIFRTNSNLIQFKLDLTQVCMPQAWIFLELQCLNPS